MKAVLFSDEDYEEFKVLLSKFDGEVRDVSGDFVVPNLTWSVNVSTDSQRSWLRNVNISKDGKPWNWIFTYNPEYVTGKENVIISSLTEAYLELHQETFKILGENR